MRLPQFERQYVERFADSTRAGDFEWFDTIAEAISAHEQDFSR